MARLPALFLAHGSPAIALEQDAYTRTLERLGRELPRPRAVAIVSAHWEAPGPVRVNAVARPAPIYDFGGFPQELYRLTYPAPGDPALAAEIARLLTDAGVSATLERSRGWDHGVWIPLRLLYPEADVPIVQISLPVPRGPEELLAAGAALAPLREQEALLVGSGGLVHNLRRLRFDDKDAPPEPWASEFDAWARERIHALEWEKLARYRGLAPHADLAAPTPEHIDPVFAVVGSARDGERASDVFEGFHYGTLSMRSFAIGNSRS